MAENAKLDRRKTPNCNGEKRQANKEPHKEPKEEQQQSERSEAVKKKQPKPKVSGKEAVPPVVVFSFLDKLDISDAYKKRLSRELDEEKAKLLVQRVLRWEGRANDLKACRTVLNQWDTWGDSDTKKEIAERAVNEESKKRELDEQRRQRAERICREYPDLGMTVGEHHVEIKNGKGLAVLGFRDEQFDKTMNYMEKRGKNSRK